MHVPGERRPIDVDPGQRHPQADPVLKIEQRQMQVRRVGELGLAGAQRPEMGQLPGFVAAGRIGRGHGGIIQQSFGGACSDRHRKPE